jgi:hypothetical protein
MTSITSLLPAQLAPEAQTNKTDAGDAQTPADCFSILLQTLITPFAAPSPLPAQTSTFEPSVNSAPQTVASPAAKPERAEAADEKTAADDDITVTATPLINPFVQQQPVCPIQAETTTVNLLAVETETNSPAANAQPQPQKLFTVRSLQPDVVADEASGVETKPGIIFDKASFDKASIEQRAGAFEELPVLQSAPTEKSAVLRVRELEPSNNSAPARRNDSELSPAPVMRASAPLNQPIISVEQQRMLESPSWQKQQLFDSDFSPSRKPLAVIAAAVEGLRDVDEPQPRVQAGMVEAAEPAARQDQQVFNLNLPAPLAPRVSFAATLERLRVTSESQLNLNPQPEKSVGKTDAPPQTQATAEPQAEFAQTNISTETVAQSATANEITKDSTATDVAPKNPAKSDNRLTREAQLSPQTAQTSAFQRAGIQDTVSEAVQTIKTKESVATQVSHAMTQLADAGLAHREQRSIRIRLRPEELGEVEIKITTDDRGHLNAHISVEQDFTRRAIEDGLNHLRETMQQAGVNIGEINVSISQLTSGGAGAHTESHSQTAVGQQLSATHTSPSSDENAGGGESNEERLLSVRA